MPRSIRSWFSIALVAFVSSCAAQPPPRSLQSELLGDVMPSFESKTLNGNQLFSGAFHGRRLVVSFVSSDCEACGTTLEAAQAMYSDLSDVVVVGVFEPDDADDALSTVKRLELHFPVVVDEGGAIAKRFHVEKRPTTFVTDSYGRVQWVGGANVTLEGLTRAVQNL
jgi:peroxiredoxin